MTCTVTIAPGRNFWTFARTDRDGATEEDVRQSAVALMWRLLGDGTPYELLPIPSAPGVTGAVIGAARPVVISAVRGSQFPALQEGQLVGRAQDCPELQLVKASKPWFVYVGFDWRSGATTIPWPALEVSALGLRSWGPGDQLDWLLFEARHAGAGGEDTTWATEWAKKAQEVAGEAADLAASAAKSILLPIAGVGFALTVVAAGYIAWSMRRG